MRYRLIMAALAVLLLPVAACAPAAEQAEDMATEGQTYPNVEPTTVFQNDRLVAQGFTMEPDVWAGDHSHDGNQLAVTLEGGTMVYREAGEETEVTYVDGQVFWVDAVASHDHAAKDATLQAVILTLADAEMGSGTAQAYPTTTPDVVFENDRLIVQLFTAEPDAWVGEHSHDGNQLVVVLRGGTMTYREGGEDTDVIYGNGEVFWIDAVAAHDHAAKDTPLEALLITLK